MCWRVSDCRQKEHAGVEDRDHLKRFFLVARVLLRYLMVKLKMFLGTFLWTFDHRLRVLLLAWRRMEERIKPCDFSSWWIRSSLSFCIAFKTCFVFRNWSYWMLTSLTFNNNNNNDNKNNNNNKNNNYNNNNNNNTIYKCVNWSIFWT